jgi:hypothetical protein
MEFQPKKKKMIVFAIGLHCHSLVNPRMPCVPNPDEKIALQNQLPFPYRITDHVVGRALK